MEKIKIQNYGLFSFEWILTFCWKFYVPALASLYLTVLEKVLNFFLGNIWSVLLFENKLFGSAQLSPQFYSTLDCKPSTHHPSYKWMIQFGHELENIRVSERDMWQHHYLWGLFNCYDLWYFHGWFVTRARLCSILYLFVSFCSLEWGFRFKCIKSSD